MHSPRPWFGSPRLFAFTDVARTSGNSSCCTDCGHIALPIVLLGATLVAIACRSLGRPPSRPRRQLDYGRSTTFTISSEGITDTQAAGIQEFCTTNRYRARKRPPIPTTRLYCTSAINNPLKKPMILMPLLYSAPLLASHSRGQGYEEPQEYLKTRRPVAMLSASAPTSRARNMRAVLISGGRSAAGTWTPVKTDGILPCESIPPSVAAPRANPR